MFDLILDLVTLVLLGICSCYYVLKGKWGIALIYLTIFRIMTLLLSIKAILLHAIK